MNQGDIFKKIGQILNELQDQYEFLAHNPEQLNELELELFLANANFLSDHVQIVKKLNNNKTVKELPEPVVEPVEAQAAPEPEALPDLEPVQEIEESVQEIEEPTPDIEEPVQETKEEKYSSPAFEFIINHKPSSDKFDFEEKPVDSIFDRQLSEEEERIIAEKQKLMESRSQQEDAKPQSIEEITEQTFVTDNIEEATLEEVSAPSVEPDPAPEPQPAIIQNPEPNNPRPTLNDILAAKTNVNPVNLNLENSKPPITDLKRAITLNEKLLYIKDLFNGYNLAYSEAIDLINKMPDLKTADTFLKNNYAEKNNWASKQTTVDKFYDLLNQRFS